MEQNIWSRAACQAKRDSLEQLHKAPLPAVAQLGVEMTGMCSLRFSQKERWKCSAQVLAGYVA